MGDNPYFIFRTWIGNCITHLPQHRVLADSQHAVSSPLRLLPKVCFQACSLKSFTGTKVHKLLTYKTLQFLYSCFRMYVVRTINITPATVPLLQEVPQHKYSRAPTQTHRHYNITLKWFPPSPPFFYHFFLILTARTSELLEILCGRSPSAVALV